MGNIKAIETHYKGYRFRSRLEARWAVLLDFLGCHYQYEPEGFDFGGDRYLPDFWLPIAKPEIPGSGYWLEIKPTLLTDREERLLRLLVAHTGHHALAFAGDIWPGQFIEYKFALSNRHNPDADRDVRTWKDDTAKWAYGLCYPMLASPKWWNDEPMDLDAAFAAARSARFEHGETPQ
jgi:hypothetical protein